MVEPTKLKTCYFGGNISHSQDWRLEMFRAMNVEFTDTRWEEIPGDSDLQKVYEKLTSDLVYRHKDVCVQYTGPILWSCTYSKCDHKEQNGLTPSGGTHHNCAFADINNHYISVEERLYEYAMFGLEAANYVFFYISSDCTPASMLELGYALACKKKVALFIAHGVSTQDLWFVIQAIRKNGGIVSKDCDYPEKALSVFMRAICDEDIWRHTMEVLDLTVWPDSCYR